jgi:hypothetical protein
MIYQALNSFGVRFPYVALGVKRHLRLARLNKQDRPNKKPEGSIFGSPINR